MEAATRGRAPLVPLTAWRFRIEVADGDNFARSVWSEIEVDAPSAIAGRLLAEQLALTPQPGKPEHMQIVATVPV